MFSQFFNWRTTLAFIAIAIVTGTIFYSDYLSKKIAADERRKVNVWVQSLKTRAATSEQSALELTNIITSGNIDIPIIGTDENDRPLGNEFLNLDSALVRSDTNYLQRKVDAFKRQHEPVKVMIVPSLYNKYYYGDSALLQQVRYYPIIQLIIVAMFIIIMLITVSTRNKSTQNQVWAGMAKETAHQLGTPLSSLQGWVEMLKEIPGNEKMVVEMSKDVDRLKLVSDRFGKIGSIPQLEEKNVVTQVENMVAYIKRRATDRVSFNINSFGEKEIPVMINAPLFDWVIENLLKNALDSMEGQGRIDISIRNEAMLTTIDVTDTGKGISKQNISKVFKPGFTTKKRGWGLGLSLSKRIIEQYHKGELFVKHSDPGKGTTFRILLKK